MVKARKYVVTKRFSGLPKRDDYSVVEAELPPLQNGEILVKTEWISVDPYIRGFHEMYPLPYDQFSYQVGVVQDSKNPRFPVGTRVVSHKGWTDYYVADANDTSNPMETIYKLPDLNGLSASLGVGAVGMHGATAYLALLDVLKPSAGQTIVITSAAGAVGSLVGQIAKLKGLRVVGLTSSDDKVQLLENELGFDKAINYKTKDIDTALKQAAPKGVDLFLDGVGGETSSIIISQMNEEGRVVVIGAAGSYNDPQLPLATIIQPSIVAKRLKIEGFIIWHRFSSWPRAFGDLVNWISSGQIKVKEHITEGFENLFDALIGLLNGENAGKAVVRI